MMMAYMYMKKRIGGNMKKIGMYTKGLFHTLVLVTALLMVSQIVQADPHSGQSSKVAIIGSPGVINGGTFPTSGAVGELGDFTFTNLAPGSVNTANLAAFDTVLLNVASSQMGCNVNTLTAAAKADLVTFVNNGGKLLIYDSECSAQNYGWLPYTFTTDNPGAAGARGTLTITEENILSTSTSSDIHYINYAALGSNTDAVGDMNVMTTLDSNWCLDMSGTNVNRVTGPVHTYAKYGNGLLIYNGLDVDYLGSGFDPAAGLRKIWVQELQSASALLPCGIKVVGITLSPASATNIVGQTHTVTATLTDLLGNPQPSILVIFSIISGPNSPFNASGTTDASGQASFTYTGSGGVGQDKIKACFTDLAGKLKCDEATKDWKPLPNTPPVANAGKDQNVEQDSLGGASVTLDGSASTDDGNIQLLTYSWTWAGGSATGVSPTVTLPLGTTTVTLTVDDGQFTATDTVDIKVVDTTAPVLTLPKEDRKSVV